MIVGVVFFFIIGGLTIFLFLSGSHSKGLLDFGEIEVIKIEGPIFDSLHTIKELHRLQKSNSIKAVVLRIDSPGGAVAPSQEIYEEVKKLKAVKKVVVSMGTMAASGGYYIACAADKILAQPGTITGSIGVIMESFGFQNWLEKSQLENRVLKSGMLKDVGSPFRSMTPEEQAYLQSVIDNMYGQFTEAVSQSRNISPEKIKILSDGRVFTGEQAYETGLVDGLGTIYDAINEAKKLAGLAADAGVIWPHEEKGVLDFLFPTSSVKSKIENFLGNFKGFQLLYMISY
ncbi:MAG: hypothetical protein A3G32_07525 [Deltaproteobacteria bacterium RIFCSPLOWO2_12_FULL_40_28]|nr:MAG: hypothetical protein A3C45_03315 [Deltaproteobacteria bacterium RIFCSPHIGHO2_02_FULL_40_28]OGQ20286.1 MAG: hypothetical protein A3E27_06420 [Deltaproteobacteria bacterium RIFCSPHIGHO2_12_FULL_40_32]OGQ40397.1 MAG: hypothetical protein A3I69_06930 [Deltaproteobacteria bacterium RIFCSPLOWO2_02_FULL_40_36]OGQ54866.1 MAG: hypothetical protein A3G32_07525 [Deltaproteobacteria bacterium RIFCSPLOWO2_12_FULL_40_28]